MANVKDYDFCGYATKANVKCSDGRNILPHAFKHNDGQQVPLVWNHDHTDPFRVLGHAILENRDDGVYTYGFLNNTEAGIHMKELVQHGDVTALSIYANHLKQSGPNVLHGDIREVSLTYAGANPGAYIDNVIQHNDDGTEYMVEDEAVIYTGGKAMLEHSDESNYKPEDSTVVDKSLSHSDDETIADIFNTMNDKQKKVVYALVGEAVSGDEEDDDNEDDSKGGNNMKHNLFDNEENKEDNVLSHSEIEAIFADAKRCGSLQDSVLQHGITDVDWLFPEARNLNTPPSFIQREMGWVTKVMSGVHKSPFSRIKSMHADIREDEARALGYMKGNYKKEEVFSLLKRTTTPCTIYKKQKMDRDDIIDITDFDVVSWLKSEMRMMLDEEIARSVLIGDGRLASSDDKINEGNIRPIWTDDDLYCIKALVENAANATDNQKAKDFIKKVIKSRKNYKGSGEPTLYTTEDVVTDCLLIEDTNGRFIYESVAKLAQVLRVKEIVTVPVMENQSRTVSGATHNLLGIIVNLADYNMGADKGGAVSMFDDFDIDYNQQKYLIETRCSGALTKPFSAITIESTTAS